MSTSTFSVTRDDVCKEALAQLGVIDDTETPTANQLTTCTRSLNFMLKRLVQNNWWLWTSVWVSVPLVIGKQSYTLGPSGADITTDRPQRIRDDSYIRNPNGNDTTLSEWSRSDYDIQSSKTSQGIPNSFYYDPQIPNGVVYPWPVVAIAGYTIYLNCQRPIFDITNPTDTFDVPQEAYDLLAYGLALRIGPKFGVDFNTMKMMKSFYDEAVEALMNANQEEASTIFTVKTQRYR